MSQIDNLVLQLNALKDKIEASEQTLDGIVEGGINDVVVTDGGKTHPSLEKWFNDNFQSLYNALQGFVDDAEQFAQLAQDIYDQVNGGIHYDGLWNASTGTFPPAPAEGSSMYKVSVNGTIGATTYLVGDYILYSTFTNSYEHIRNGNNYLTIDGVAASSEKLETAITFDFTGDVSGDVTFDGTSNQNVILTFSDLTFSDLDGTPTTLSGYGITDASPANHTHDLDDLGNVSIAVKDIDDIIIWNGANWVNVALEDLDFATENHTHSINDIVQLQQELDNKLNIGETASNSELLDGFDSTFFSPATHNHQLDLLSNTTITNRDIDDIIIWDGSSWVNEDLKTKLTKLNTVNTGIYSGGELSINAIENNKFDVASLQGLIVDTDNNTYHELDFDGLEGVVPEFIATNPVSYIGIGTSGIVQSSSPFTESERRMTIPLGVVVHSNNSTINTFNNLQQTNVQPLEQLYDHIIHSGANFCNVSGNLFSKGTGNLNISKTSGKVFKLHINTLNDDKNPHTLELLSDTDLTFRYRLQDSTEFADTMTIDPDNYDNGGVLTSVPLNQYTIQYINVFPSNIVRVQYGQTTFNTISDAVASINDDFLIEPNIEQNALLRAFVVIRQGASDLSNQSEAVFIEANKFGSTADTTVSSDIYRTQIYNSSSTGLLTGGVLTVNTLDDTTFDISAGVGKIIDNITDPTNPIVKEVYWDNVVGLSVDNISTQNLTYVLIDENENFVQQANFPTTSQLREYVVLGVLVHINGATLEGVSHIPKLVYNESLNTVDLANAIGKINIRGNEFLSNGTGLTLEKTGGETFGLGFNYANSQLTPNNVVSSALNAPDLRYIYRDGSGGIAFETPSPDVKPALYDDGSGTLATVNNNKWSIQRIYFYPESDGILIAYGQNTYNNESDARSAIETEDFALNIPASSPVKAFLIVRGGATDLSLSADAIFINTGKFGDTSVASAVATGNLQDGYNNSIIPQILTSTLGAFTIQSGTTNTDNIIVGKNTTGTDTFAVDGNGDVTGNSFTGNSFTGNGAGLTNVTAVNSALLNSQSGTYYLDWPNFTNTPSTLTGYGITDAINVSEKGSVNGVATLNSSGVIPDSQMPALAVSDTFVVSSEVDMLNLTAETGDLAVRTDENKTYILRVNDPTVIGNWQEILTPTSAITSVNGLTGTVTLDLGLSGTSIDITGGNSIDLGTIFLGISDKAADSELLDGINSLNFARLDIDNNYLGVQTILGGNPLLVFNESDAPVDNRVWGIRAQAEAFRLEARPDDQSSATAFMQVERTGTVIDSINLSASNVQVNTNTIYHTGNLTKTVIDDLNIDADTLDSLNSSQFVRSDATDELSGSAYIFNGSSAPIRSRAASGTGASAITYMQYQDSAGTRLGYTGFPTTGNSDFYVKADSGRINLNDVDGTKLETTVTGVTTTGTHTANSFEVGGYGKIRLVDGFSEGGATADDVKLESLGYQIYHSDTNNNNALANDFFQWYARGNRILSMTGEGDLSVTGNVSIDVNGKWMEFNKDTITRDTIYWNSDGTTEWKLFHESSGNLRFNRESGSGSFDVTNSAITCSSSITSGLYLFANNTQGTLQMGPQNSGFCHMITDRDRFYFNTNVNVNGEVVIHGSSYKIASNGAGTFNGVKSANTSEFDLGIHGGYNNSNGTGADWGSNIWSMGISYDGTHAGPSHSKGVNPYGLQWHRGSHTNADTRIGEGLYVYRGGTNVGGIGLNGIFTTGVYDNTSDERLKDIHGEYKPIGIANVKALVYTKDGRVQYGYSAQEVEKYTSVPVNKSKTERFDDERSLTYAMVHTAKIAELEAENGELRERLVKLENIVEKLLDGE